MSMMNIDSVTAHLSKMSPQQLQQFASMHMDDPIMLAAAKFVSNQQTKMQQSQQPAPGTPPKVNEQTVASIAPQQMPQQQMQPQQQMPPQAQGLPEDSGIAQLPARNMQGMAEGGIVAFAGNESSLVEEPQMSFGDIVQSLMSRGVDRPSATELARKYITQPLREKMSEWANPAENQSPEETARLARSGMALPPAAPPINMTPTAPAAPAPRPPAPRPPAPRPAPTDISTLAQKPAGGTDFAAMFAKTLGSDATTDQFAAQRGEIAASEKQTAQENIDQIKAEQAARGIAGSGRETRLAARESALEKASERNSGLALLEAGLGMMQSRGSGLSGIAEGAMRGTKAYTAGMEKIASAREKLDDARDQLDDLRRNEGTMNSKDLRAARNALNQTVTQGKKELLTGTVDAYKLKREDAARLLGFQATEATANLDRASRERVAGMQIQSARDLKNMPGDLENFVTKLGGGNLQKGYEIYKQENAIPAMYKQYTDKTSGITADPEFLKRFPTFEAYIASSGLAGKGGSSGFVQSPTGAVAPR